jgi:hypothetical protein
MGIAGRAFAPPPLDLARPDAGAAEPAAFLAALWASARQLEIPSPPLRP